MFRRKKYDYDLIVIGSGAGGSVGARYAASLGKKVAIFETADIGGECPNWACIPTKALLKSASVYETIQTAHIFGMNVPDLKVDFAHIHRRKNLVVSRTGASHGEQSFENTGIHVIKHKAMFVSPHEVEAHGKIYSAHTFLLASGTDVLIPPVPGLQEAGYITFKQAVNLTEPPRSLFILGAGAVGCEFAQIFSIFGTQVTIAARSKLLSNEDVEVQELVQALFENDGITVLTNTSVTKVEIKGKHKVVFYKHGEHEKSIEVEEILVATGKVPSLSFGPEKAGIRTNQSGIIVNKYLQTSASHIYAAGDLVGPYQFTHTADYQSGVAAKNAFSRKKTPVDYRAVTRCVFVMPEVASVGINEEQAQQKGIRYKKGLAPIAILGRANTSEAFDGFVKVLVDSNGTLIGGSIVAPRAGEMIHEIALAIQARIKAQVLAEMIHAFPTYSEAVKFACSNIE